MVSYVSLTASYAICLELCLPLKRNRGDIFHEPELDATQSKPYYIIEDHSKALIRHILATPHYHCLITNDRPSRNLLYSCRGRGEGKASRPLFRKSSYYAPFAF
jgi:hypothetical protein